MIPVYSPSKSHNLLRLTTDRCIFGVTESIYTWIHKHMHKHKMMLIETVLIKAIIIPAWREDPDFLFTSVALNG